LEFVLMLIEGGLAALVVAKYRLRGDVVMGRLALKGWAVGERVVIPDAADSEGSR